jgi:hypothetical protein
MVIFKFWFVRFETKFLNKLQISGALQNLGRQTVTNNYLPNILNYIKNGTRIDLRTKP